MSAVATRTAAGKSARRTVEKLLRQQAALADFGTFAFYETNLQKVLTEAARICAVSLNVPLAKICRSRSDTHDLVITAGFGWNTGVIGFVMFPVDESTTQGRAFVTGEPVIVEDISKNNSYSLPGFYEEHGVAATAGVLIKGRGNIWGVLEVDSRSARTFDFHDVSFLTGFANVIAEAVSSLERTDALRAEIEEKRLLLEEKDRLLQERKQRETRVLELQRKLLHVVRLNAMGEMTVAIAHELNQPLAAIANYMGAAKRTLASANPRSDSVASARQLIDKTSAQALRAGKIIRDLRDIVEKRESGHTAEDIGAVVHESLELMQHSDEFESVGVGLLLDTTIPPVMIDKTQIQQVLANLIRNACEAMLAVKDRHLLITTSMGAPGFANVTIEDTGPGLPPAVLAQLFQPFITTKATGLGVGLMLCRTLVEVNGGRIWHLADKPTGAGFGFSIPLKSPDER